MMTSQNGQNKLWTEDDIMRCLQYLQNQRAEREINNDGVMRTWSVVTDDGIITGEYHDNAFAGMNDYYTPSTRLLKWQKRFVFRLPPPFHKIWVKLVLSRENKD